MVFIDYYALTVAEKAGIQHSSLFTHARSTLQIRIVATCKSLQPVCGYLQILRRLALGLGSFCLCQSEACHKTIERGTYKRPA